MRLFKAKYKSEDRQQTSERWYADFFNQDGRRCRLVLFTSRRASEAFSQKIVELCGLRSAGVTPDADLQRWIDSLSPKYQNKLIKWGLIDGRRIEGVKPLKTHIEDYINVLKTKGFSVDYVRRMESRLLSIVKDCRFNYFRDISQSAVELYIGKLKDDLSHTTAAHYFDALNTFLNWCIMDSRLLNNPIARIQKPARDSKLKGVLTPEQFISLIKTTFEKNTVIENTSGQERAVLYMLAGTTGLRRNELLNLTWSDIDLVSDNPFVRVRACIAKNGKEALQPLPAIAINLLTALKAHIKPLDTDRVFSAFDMAINTAGLIRDDLKAAQIELIDKDGNEICFHSLRNSYISWLANSKTPAKIIQKLARHSDPRLTFNTYARTFEDAEQEALNFLPKASDFVFANFQPRNIISERTHINRTGQQNEESTKKTAIMRLEQNNNGVQIPLGLFERAGSSKRTGSLFIFR